MSNQITDLPDRSSYLKLKQYANAGLCTTHAEASKKSSSTVKKVLGGLSDQDIDDSDERPMTAPTKVPVHKITYPEKLKCTGRQMKDVSAPLLMWGEVSLH